MGAPSGFAARRPNASSLPNFELPPPPLSGQQKYHYSTTQSSSAQGHPASVGNLLTPPSNMPGDGLSPVSGAPSNAPHTTQGVQQQYTPNGYVWSPHHQTATYGFHSAGPTQQNFQQQQRQGPPPPPYEQNLPPFPGSSAPMSAPATLPTMPSHQHHGMHMTASTPVSSAPPHPSPVHAQEGFRPPPTPTYYSQASSTPQQPAFPYSSGPSPTQQSPMSAGAMPRMSPSTAGPVPSMPATSPHAYQRPFGQYPLPGPVLSNVQNPNGQMQLVNGPLSHGMPLGFNSGHAANLQQMYHGAQHSHPQQQQPPNDRPFKCDQCPQSFNRNHDLKRHKRIHLAVKPFPCGHCDKSFSRKDALKRHILVKGCGKAAAQAAANDGDKQDSSVSPDEKNMTVHNENVDQKPVVAAH
ncbi:hypothetical protein NA57DRAFT_76925 [Rhizodiscina lignyota]|uniref:C2H2-type domain-containing protein n=1 Tax=Rhizodiscina lignyota TaxID=1504668 RepID=A0A9P4IF42_9PEZI|nr:hypothetical protein NA57DRAFT_76925 [Rhizodiscina lignyota]